MITRVTGTLEFCRNQPPPSTHSVCRPRVKMATEMASYIDEIINTRAPVTVTKPDNTADCQQEAK
jgi:hypothetical protein